MQHLLTGSLLAVVAIVICVLALTRLQSPKPMSRAEFTKQFAERLQSELPGAQVVIGSENEIRVKSAKREMPTMFLDNAYADYVRDPNDLSALIQKYARSYIETPASEDPIDRSRIVPIIKDRSWIAEMQRSLRARGAVTTPDCVFDDLNEELVIVYAEDNPRSIRYLIPQNLQEIGATRGELRGLAVENLRRLLSNIVVRPHPLASIVTADGNYEASLLLFDELWTKGQIQVDGDIVVAVPARDTLLVTGSRNPAGIAKVREMASEWVRESSYHLTDTLFVYRNGSFKRLGQQ